MADNKQEQSQKKEEPIIIKKKKVHGGHGGHGGAWKVAYADFVTAMMAFFIVMWILASSEKTKQAVTAYFNDPGAFSFINGKPTIPIDLQLKPAGKGEGKGTNIISFNEEMADSIVSKLRKKAIEDSVKALENVKKVQEEIKKDFKDAENLKPDLKEVLTHLKLEMTQEGLRIELIEEKESVFFEIGSANLKNQAKEVLKILAQEIAKLPNNVEIEGHTDSRPYSSKNGYSNWDLSSERANSARRILDNNGLWNGQISKVTGFADRKLRNSGNPFDVTNRRVSILIRNMNAKDFMKIEQEQK
jgi:chemotaxis protein MotB